MKLRDSEYGRVLFSGKDQAVYLFTKDERPAQPLLRRLRGGLAARSTRRAARGPDAA